jgi:hypothetical protein
MLAGWGPGGCFVLALMLALPLHVAAQDLDDEGEGEPAEEVEPVAPATVPAATIAQPLLTTTTLPDASSPAAGTPPHARGTPAAPAPPTPLSPASPTDAPKRLGRPFPTPIQPPAPPDDPEVHIRVVPRPESALTNSRRGANAGGGSQAGATAGAGVGAGGGPGIGMGGGASGAVDHDPHDDLGDEDE